MSQHTGVRKGHNAGGGTNQPQKMQTTPNAKGAEKFSKTGNNSSDLTVQGKSTKSPLPPGAAPSESSVGNIMQALNLDPENTKAAKEEYLRLVDEQKKFEKEFPDKFANNAPTNTTRAELMDRSKKLKGNEHSSPLFKSLFAVREKKNDQTFALSLDALIDFFLLKSSTDAYQKLKPQAGKEKQVSRVNVIQDPQKDKGKSPIKPDGVQIPITIERKGQLPADDQPQNQESSSHPSAVKRKTEDNTDGKVQVQPKVIFKEVSVIPEGHMLVKIADYHKLQIELRNSNESVEELSSRLSAIASNKLKDGNPNIADLSDRNRPTKLGEQFGALYDDEWSEAFEEMTEGEKCTDEEAISQLMKILKDTYRFCLKVSSIQLQHMTEMLTRAVARPFIPDFSKSDEASSDSPEACEDRMEEETKIRDKYARGFRREEAKWSAISDMEKPLNELTEDEKEKLEDAYKIGEKYAKGMRKEGAMGSITDLKKSYHQAVLQVMFKMDVEKIQENVVKFADRCLELLWLMCVQDPPMQIQWAMEKQRVDVNYYKFYQSKGKWVKLSVWPAVYLCQGGSIVSKGYVVGGPQPEEDEPPTAIDTGATLDSNSEEKPQPDEKDKSAMAADNKVGKSKPELKQEQKTTGEPTAESKSKPGDRYKEGNADQQRQKDNIVKGESRRPNREVDGKK